MSSSQRPPADNTQYSQQKKNIYAAGGIRTRKPSKRAAVKPRLSPRGHWDRQINKLYKKYSCDDGSFLFYVASFDYVYIDTYLCNFGISIHNLGFYVSKVGMLEEICL
jgi:hypothetical protein